MLLDANADANIQDTAYGSTALIIGFLWNDFFSIK
jgi:hypothetical protein